MRWIERVTLANFRGLNGSVRFSRGLNIVVGPNCSGKTALIEALAYLLITNLDDLREAHAYLSLLHAARGSPSHSLACVVSDGEARVTGSAIIENTARALSLTISKKLTYESAGPTVRPVMELRLLSSRGCAITYRVDAEKILISFNEKCTSGSTATVAVITPGIYPYNFFDQLVGKAKRSRSKMWRVLSEGFRIDDALYTVDLATDDWGRISAYVREVRGKSEYLVNFYSIGRGLQRALILKAALSSSDIVLVDEVESAMHPELLSEVAQSIIDSVKSGKQVIVTTQSLEAARFIMAAFLGVNRSFWRSPEKIAEYVRKMCSDSAFKSTVNEVVSLIILKRRDGVMQPIELRGCRAFREVLMEDDVRLLYTLVR